MYKGMAGPEGFERQTALVAAALSHTRTSAVLKRQGEVSSSLGTGVERKGVKIRNAVDLNDGTLPFTECGH